MKKSVETQLIDFLKENPSRWASAELQRKEWRNRNGTLATPRSIVRRLEENAEAGGMLEVSYDDHNNAHYQIKQEHKKKIRQLIHLPPSKEYPMGLIREIYQAVCSHNHNKEMCRKCCPAVYESLGMTV